jgi:hypothetical protein
MLSHARQIDLGKAIKQRETDIMLEEKKKEDLNIEHEVEEKKHLLEGIREKLKEEEQQKDIEVEELRLRRSCRIEVMLLLMI